MSGYKKRGSADLGLGRAALGTAGGVVIAITTRIAEASRKDLGGADVVLGEKSGRRSLLPWISAGISRGPYPLGWNVKNVKPFGSGQK